MATPSSAPTEILEPIESALAARRFERARRLCAAGLEQSGDLETRNQLWKLSHQTARAMADFERANFALSQIQPQNEAAVAEIALRRVEDYLQLARGSLYRNSEEAKAGLTQEQYGDKMCALALETLDGANLSDANPVQIEGIAAQLEKDGQSEYAARLRQMFPISPLNNAQNGATKNDLSPVSMAKVGGALRFPDGAPVANAVVTIGLNVESEMDDPASFLKPDMHSMARIGDQQSLQTRTDANGHFSFAQVPVGKHEFLAVTLDGTQFEVPTRFLLHGFEVAANQETRFDLEVGEWHSAPSREIFSPFAAEMTIGGAEFRLIHQENWKNPFFYDFPRQIVSFPLAGATNSHFQLFRSDAPDEPQPFQKSGDEIVFFADLKAHTDVVWALYESQNAVAAPELSIWEPQVEDGGQAAIFDTGRAKFRVPWGDAKDDLAPLLGVRGEDGIWRGNGRWVLAPGLQIVSRQTKMLESGPLLCRVEVRFCFSTGEEYAVIWTFQRGEATAIAHEISPNLEGAAWEWSLREWSGAGRGYLHWTPENGAVHWTDLRAENRELARLQESVPWWIYPAGFGYAMSPDGLEERDFVGVFTLRRGEWIDREFETLAQGPIDADGRENRELDWPFPEMVGSTISMISAHTDAGGDAFFRFPLFDGERHWGVLVSTLERNDGPWKEISEVGHKNSSPRLQDFKNWHLDEADAVLRPHVVTQRTKLKDLRRKRESPIFASAWQKIRDGQARGAAQGLAFAVEGDPLVAWRLKRELVGVAPVRAKMTLLGRDFGDMYSPVGARPITQWAENYDLIAASGAFTPDEEREVRAFLMLMGHLYLSTDLMNWRYGSRNANFEADRVDVVGAVGLCFPGNPDAEKFVEHAAELMERSLTVYCTPGSGKWYENPACYYLQASKCRTNLAWHLAAHDFFDPTQIPRFKDFLRWGVLLLMPPTPHDYGVMRDGASAPEYDALEKVRRLPPIGDHAHLGPWVPEHYALMSRLYRPSDPQFADELLWAYQAGGSDGGNFGNLPLFFAALEESDLRLASAPAPALESRRLEGFGAVLRENFGQNDEWYLLWKQGPGGYRYHRSEGSFILFADGKPLVYDGGEGGETWRHSTLSFGPGHAPLAAGHIERFVALPGLDFVQGVHPRALEAGEPVFLSDQCDHWLVPEAWRRFEEPNPAVVRSLCRVGTEYVIVHDELDLPEEIEAHWHLQVVAGSEKGNAREGFRFWGRFGTDLQVVLPDQDFAQTKLETLPILEHHLPPEQCFATRHLQLSGAGNRRAFLALLRPLAGEKSPLISRGIWREGVLIGASVKGENLDDHLFFSHRGVNYSDQQVRFEGRYGAVLRRETGLELSLFDGQLLEADGVRLESDGPAVLLRVDPQNAKLWARGSGQVRGVVQGKTIEFNCDEKECYRVIPLS